MKLGSDNINLWLVREGWAWHFVKYAPKDVALVIAEKEAREARRGLWRDRAPMAPWEFRTLKKAPKIAEVTPKAVKPENATLSHWLNSKSRARHNSTSRWFGKTKAGRPCATDEGKACGQCGG